MIIKRLNAMWKKDDLWDIIAEELLKYDEAQIIYSERGAKIVIDANDKKSICVTRTLRKR